MGFWERYQAYRLTEDYKKDHFYNKSKLKLIVIVFPILIIFCLLIKTVTNFDGYAPYFGILVAAVFLVNFIANYLTRKKFED